jgi:hypothetical protein
MKFRRYLLSAFWLISIAASAQVRVVKTATLSLPAGYVVGAAIGKDGKTVAVQQIDEFGEIIGLHRHRSRQLSLWSVDTHSMLESKGFGEISPNPDGVCGRVHMLSHSHQILICSSFSYIDVLDGSNLTAVGKLASGPQQQIYDFAVDEAREKLVVVSLNQDQAVHVTVYSLRTGAQQQSETLPGDDLSTMNVALDPINGNFAINVVRRKRSGESSDIRVCHTDGSSACSKLSSHADISEVSFLGNQLLLVPADTESKKSCVLGAAADGNAVSSQYCFPTSGVHVALGVVMKRFVVAYTGLSHYSPLREESTTISNSYSVWEAERRLPDATIEGPPAVDASQRFGRIVTASSVPMFLIYQVHSRELTLYSITAF